MTEIGIKDLGDQLKAIGPTDEHRQQFGQTFVGSLLGQTIVLIGMIVAYLASLALLKRYLFDDLEGLRETMGDLSFYTLVAVPFVVIILFSLLPTSLRALRDRRLMRRVIGGASLFTPGYFRLYPYSAMEREQFVRHDGVDATVCAWLQLTKDSILYLSGASGSGKSSLLAASVIPKLREKGWAIAEARAFGDPVEKLRQALAEIRNLGPKEPPKDVSLRDLLTKAAKTQAQKRSGGSLLIVIDQFEEFLILQNVESQKELATLLKDLAKNPISGLKLLLVFRSDYRPLVFRLELPPLTANSNWQEVGAYSRGEAESFLQGGGRIFSPESLDTLFKGLDRIEDTKQLYRLVTLNMVGLVLEKMGRGFEGDPSRLIQIYLRDCLTNRDIRDYAKPVLSAMITDSGTKEPRTEAELARLTGLAPWQVSATAAGLAQQGLVRKLEGKELVWEIAHDFLARMMGQLIGRIGPTYYQRVQPFLAPVVLASWLGLVTIGISYWLEVEERRAGDNLRDLGAVISKAKNGGLLIRFSSPNDKTIRQINPHLRKIRESFDLAFDPPFHNPALVIPLPGSFAGILPGSFAGYTNLESGPVGLPGGFGFGGYFGYFQGDMAYPWGGDGSDFSYTTGYVNNFAYPSPYSNPGLTITNLEPLRGINKIRSLNLLYAYRIESISPLESLAGLQSLALCIPDRITSLEPLKGLTGLKSLVLSCNRHYISLKPLKGMTGLSSLDLRFTSGITSLEPLKGREIEIIGADKELMATLGQGTGLD